MASCVATIPVKDSAWMSVLVFQNLGGEFTVRVTSGNEYMSVEQLGNLLKALHKAAELVGLAVGDVFLV